jgi:Flp pilus assembly protein TadG
MFKRGNLLSTKRQDPAQSVVELALAMPMLLIILMGMVDLGRLYFTYLTVVDSARVGARYGTAKPPNCPISQADPKYQNLVSLAQAEAAGSDLDITKLSVTITLPDPNSCDLSNNVIPGSQIKVTVRYDFGLITTYTFGGGTIPLSVSNSMVVLGN